MSGVPYTVAMSPTASEQLSALPLAQQQRVRRRLEAVAAATALRILDEDEWLEVEMGRVVAEGRLEADRRVLVIHSVRVSKP